MKDFLLSNITILVLSIFMRVLKELREALFMITRLVLAIDEIETSAPFLKMVMPEFHIKKY